MEAGCWEDRRIGAGEAWYSRIEEAMAECKAAVLAVSADFLTCDFVLKEEAPKLLKRREKRGVWVIPLIAEACAWKKVTWLAAMQA